jgi:hypothetical protein
MGMKSLYAIVLLSFVSVACGYKQAQVEDQQKAQEFALAKQSEVEACFFEARRRTPQMSGGSITIRADQLWNGEITSPRLIRGFAGSNEIFECVRAKMTGWRMEPTPTWGPLEFTWSYEFAPPSVNSAENKNGR